MSDPDSEHAPRPDGTGVVAGTDAPSAPVRSYVAWLLRWRLVVVAGVLALLVLTGIGIARLGFASNYEIYFDDNNPQLDALRALQANFSRNDNILFAVVPDSGDVFSVEALEAVRELTRAAWMLPHAARVDSITNFQHVSSSEDEIRIRDLLPDSEALDDAVIARLRSQALAERALLGRLLSPHGDVTGVNVRLRLTGDDRAAVLEAAAAARALAARIEKGHPGLELRLTGNAMLNASFPEAGLRDLTHLTPFMYLTIAVGLLVLLRSLRGAALAMLTVVFACALAMGAAGWLGIVLSSASVVAPTIVTIVAVAYSMHLVTTFLKARAEGAGARASVEQALSVNLQPLAVTALTTMVGFLSLNASEAPPFRDLGNITALGVVAAFGLSTVVLPLALLAVGGRGGRPPVLDFARFSYWVVARGRAPVVLVLSIAAASAAMVPSMELNDAFVEYFDERIEFRRDTDFVMQRLTGIYQVEYAVDAGEAFGVNRPDYLAGLEKFAAWLEMQPEVVHVSSITEVLERLNRHVGDGTLSLPGSQEQAAQFLLLYEMSVPFGLDLEDRLSVDRSSSRVTATLRNLDNATLRDFEQRAQRWLEDNVEPEMRGPAVGAAMMFAYIAERNIRAMLSGTALAGVVITLCLVLIFRSIRVGLMSMLPNLVPVVIAFGIWVLLVGQMGVALAVVAAMSLGIVVDDTVHFTCSFRDARHRLGLAPEAAVHHAFAATGTALASTSVVLVCGFAVLSLSSFQVNHGLGQLTSLVIACALAADFLMLPGLLIGAARRGWI